MVWYFMARVRATLAPTWRIPRAKRELIQTVFLTGSNGPDKVIGGLCAHAVKFHEVICRNKIKVARVLHQIPFLELEQDSRAAAIDVQRHGW